MQDDNTLSQLLRYTFVGGLAFIVDFGVLLVLTEFAGVYYLTSAAAAFLSGLLTNYTLSVLWVFHHRSFKDKWVEFAVFTVIGLFGLGMNELFIWFFTKHIHLHYLISKILSTISVFLWNFFARKFTLFRQHTVQA